ncbi:WhiB family transcriptional regulator [Mumia sp. ZJ1417]|uniref:WhiB family transcriptional regulator n=1 Tax=Mumia sp. ZJ1417 TaxID=2708082 RepID=UPI00141E1794|nr:WhiB family transcriptional regulator [Mumia sp. ZJ1417]QMW66543.1 WhiB family transcriptional regulator [Mumia sp. ZJ1417]
MHIVSDRRQVDAHTDVVPACAQMPDVYDTLSEPLEDLSRSGESWDAWLAAHAQAREACAACPLLTQCLYRAVVDGEVAGYAACTSPEDRAEMRSRLGIRLTPPDIDRIAGVRTAGSPVDHESILAARRLYPRDTFAQLAERLGCSLSTVKRHLREASTRPRTVAPARTRTTRPTVDEVLDVFDEVVSASMSGRGSTSTVADTVQPPCSLSA